MDRIGQVVREEIRLLEHVVEATADEPDHDRPDGDLGHGVARDPGTLGQRHDRYAIGDVEGDGVHHPVPVDGDRSHVDDRVDVDNDDANHVGLRYRHVSLPLALEDARSRW